MRICSVDGCESKHLAGGYCQKHYMQMFRHNELRIIKPKKKQYVAKKCSVCGCINKYKGKGYCSKHLQQIRIHGKLMPGLERNIVKK